MCLDSLTAIYVQSVCSTVCLSDFLQSSEQPLYGATQFFCFRVSLIHRTLTWTTGSLTCVRSHARVYTRGWGTPTTSQHNSLTRKNSHKFVLCSRRDSNLWSWNPSDLEADALPIEPPRSHVLTFSKGLKTENKSMIKTTKSKN